MFRPESSGGAAGVNGVDEAERVWRICLAVGEARRAGGLVPGAAARALHEAGDGSIVAAPLAGASPSAPVARWSAAEGWVLPDVADGAGRDLLELYRPVLQLRSHTTFVLAHLGQSIDGQIATRTGDSRYVNCPADITHLHRLRALCDAVIVGRETASVDDPMLTTRLVTGPNPVRVVLDPDGRLPSTIQLLTDGRADTLVVCANEHLAHAHRRFGESRVRGGGGAGAMLDLAELRDGLAQRGLYVLFVEGGGVTVSRFVEHGVADRLHLAVAPVLVGAGRSGLQLIGEPLMRDNLRPAHRLFRMGADVLWDFDLRAPRPAQGDGAGDGAIRFIG
ncbi:MAG: RibD family protein [Burkholderiaceae bacterium]